MLAGGKYAASDHFRVGTGELFAQCGNEVLVMRVEEPANISHFARD